jgi:hypothetical protein
MDRDRNSATWVAYLVLVLAAIAAPVLAACNCEAGVSVAATPPARAARIVCDDGFVFEVSITVPGRDLAIEVHHVDEFGGGISVVDSNEMLAARCGIGRRLVSITSDRAAQEHRP